MSDAHSAFSAENVTAVFIPSALLVVGTFFVKNEWTPYAVAAAALFTGFKLLASGGGAPSKCSNRGMSHAHMG